MYKKTGFVFSFEAVLSMLSICIIFSGGVYMGTKTINNYRTDQIMNECEALDRGLEMYAKSHQAVLPNTVRENNDTGKLIYDSSRVYPENISELGVIPLEQGYFTTKINLNRFSYVTRKNSEGKMTYELGTTLPNGEYYKSPRSNK